MNNQKINKHYTLKASNNEICYEGSVFYNITGINFQSRLSRFFVGDFGMYIGRYRLYFSVMTRKAMGFGGSIDSDTWIKRNLKFPRSFKGALYLENDLYHGNESYVEDWSTYVDKEQNMICIGDDNANENDVAVEFCTDTVAVLEDGKYLKAIWMKNIDFEGKKKVDMSNGEIVKCGSVESISTPFGDIHVRLNGNIINFNCREKIVHYLCFEDELHVKTFLIDIDTIDMKPEDAIFCGFDEMRATSERESGERTDVLFVYDDNYYLGLYCYNPETYDGEEDYSYDVEKSSLPTDGRGFTYYVERNPKDYSDDEFYRSKVITLAVCWLKNFTHAYDVIDDLLNTEIFNWSPNVIEKQN